MEKSGNISCVSFLLMLIICLLPAHGAFSFGFFAHRKINRMAVFTLPPEMVGFFKKHIEYLSEHSVYPDRMAHAVPGEAQRHYIDIEYLGNDTVAITPIRWQNALELFTEDSLQKHGVLPWHLYNMMHRLTKAFEDQDVDRILYNATFIGHYIADACTPLHTTRYYNGRIPAQRGIHSLWESRLPELFADDFTFFTGRAQYVNAPLTRIWELVETSHKQVDTIFDAYNKLLKDFTPDRMYAHELKGQNLVRVYSEEFARSFHQEMDLMTERQMQTAVKSIGDFWYTAWVNAGQPDLYSLEKKSFSRKHRRYLRKQQEEWNKVEKPVGRENFE